MWGEGGVVGELGGTRCGVGNGGGCGCGGMLTIVMIIVVEVANHCRGILWRL